jgi:hypothetical protein
MKTQSKKAKGRLLQQLVRDKIIEQFPMLTLNDVRSTSMGASGEDVLLSETALKKFPYYVECKSRDKIAVYNFYEQAYNDKDLEPLVVIKGNRKNPLVVVDLDHFMEIVGYYYE